jgi:predicted tellurium resistance membrane protein TerC
MHIFLQAEVWVSLLILTLLEIVLGIDNLVFLTLVSNKLPQSKRKSARKLGLFLAVVTRILLLLSLFVLTGITQPLLTLYDHVFSVRDFILLIGGLFLIVKATHEIHASVLVPSELELSEKIPQPHVKFWVIILQIIFLDIIFSIDSVITAIGMTRHLFVIISAIVISMLIMVFASEIVSHLIERFISLKMLALSFLLLVGFVLIADGLSFHIPRGYVYFAMLFSLLVESLAIIAGHKKIP